MKNTHQMFARRYAFVLYCSLLLLSAVLLAEFVLLPRLFGMPRAMLLLGFAATPDTVIDGQRINALGFTGDAVSENKAPNTVRVLLLGSSTLFNRHMAEKLKAALQKTLPDKNIELLDVGIRSHTTQADVAKNCATLRSYEWDLCAVLQRHQRSVGEPCAAARFLRRLSPSRSLASQKYAAG
jgi:hypothetical protein